MVDIPGLPSLTEAFAVLILIAPGFLTFKIFTWRAVFENVFSDLQITLWSLISSVIVFIPFSAIWQFQSLSDLQAKILQPEIILTYFLLACVIGFVPGEILHQTTRKNIRAKSVWINFAFANVGDWVKIHTSKGEVYRGWISSMSSHEVHKREIEINAPELLDTKNNKKTWKEIGNSILFTEKDILRVILLK